MQFLRVAAALVVLSGFFTSLVYTLQCLADKKWDEMLFGLVAVAAFVAIMCDFS